MNVRLRMYKYCYSNSDAIYAKFLSIGLNRLINIKNAKNIDTFDTRVIIIPRQRTINTA